MTTPDGSTPALPRPRGFFARIGDWFRRRRPYSAPVSVPRSDLVVSEHRSGEPMTVPADGGAFDFTVRYDLTWSAKGMSQATLKDRVDAYAESATRTLRNTIWPIGRRYLPHHPEATENAMNNALRDSWCYDDRGEVVSCQAAVQVTADERVTTKQRPIWEQLLELDVKHRVERHRLGYVEDMLTRWRDLLDSFGDSPVVIHAARLVDVDVAQVLDGLANRRRAMAWDLVTVLKETRDAFGQVGLFELAQSYDVAVRAFERQQGLHPGSVFESTQAAGR